MILRIPNFALVLSQFTVHHDKLQNFTGFAIPRTT